MITVEQILHQVGIDTVCQCDTLSITRRTIHPRCLWHQYGIELMPLIKEYALQVAQQALEVAANNAKIEPKHELSPGWMNSYRVNKQSILDTEIKLT